MSDLGVDPECANGAVFSCGYCHHECCMKHFQRFPEGPVYLRVPPRADGRDRAVKTLGGVVCPVCQRFGEQLTTEQIQEAHREGIISYDLLEFATFPAWRANWSSYRWQCARAILAHRSKTT